MESHIDKVWPGAGGIVGLMAIQAEDQRRAAAAQAAGRPGYIPRVAVTEETLARLNLDAQRIANIHVRRQEVAARLEKVDPVFADKGPVAREEYLNEWLKERESYDPNAGELIYQGSLKDEMEALGTKHRNAISSDVEKRAASSWENSATRIASDPEAFAEEMKQRGGDTTEYDRPLEDFLQNPAVLSEEGGVTADGSVIEPGMYMSDRWITEGLQAVSEFPIGSPERAAASEWFIRQTDLNLQASADAKQDEIDQWTAHPETKELAGNAPHQRSPIGKKKAVIDASELLLDRDLAKIMEESATGELAAFRWLGGMVDRMFSDKKGSVKELATEVFGSEQAFGVFKAAFAKKYGVELELSGQEMFEMLERHAFSPDKLSETLAADEAYLVELQREKNQVLDKRNEVLDSWSNASDITNIEDVRKTMDNNIKAGLSAEGL
jgi:hypothetical protein